MRDTSSSRRGQALVEYSLILALVAVVCILALTQIGEQASRNLQRIAEALTR